MYTGWETASRAERVGEKEVRRTDWGLIGEARKQSYESIVKSIYQAWGWGRVQVEDLPRNEKV